MSIGLSISEKKKKTSQIYYTIIKAKAYERVKEWNFMAINVIFIVPKCKSGFIFRNVFQKNWSLI